MAEHEPCIGATSDWYTPPEIFDALGIEFDLDPCSPGPGHWVPARFVFTRAEDGLKHPWYIMECPICQIYNVPNALITNQVQNFAVERTGREALPVNAWTVKEMRSVAGTESAPIDRPKRQSGPFSCMPIEKASPLGTGDAPNAKPPFSPTSTIFQNGVMAAGIVGANNASATMPDQSRQLVGAIPLSVRNNAPRNNGIVSRQKASPCVGSIQSSVMLDEDAGMLESPLSGALTHGSAANRVGGNDALIVSDKDSSPKTISFLSSQANFPEQDLGTCCPPASDATTQRPVATPTSLPTGLGDCSSSCPTCGHTLLQRKALTFTNPPFGGRNGHVTWLRRFLDHSNGVAIVRAYTSSEWWHLHVAPRAETLLFPTGKTKFIRGSRMESRTRAGVITIHEAGTRGDSPGHGVALIGMGPVANAALERSGLGHFVDNRRRAA